MKVGALCGSGARHIHCFSSVPRDSFRETVEAAQAEYCWPCSSDGAFWSRLGHVRLELTEPCPMEYEGRV